MKRLPDSIVEKTSPKKFAIAALFFLAMIYLIDFSVFGCAELARITGGGKILDMERGYSVSKAYGILEALGENGRAFYLGKILPLDIFFPVSMMLFNLAALGLLVKKLTKTGSPLRWIVILPIIDMILDWSENVGFAAMLMNYPERLVNLCTINSCITRTKLWAVCIIYASMLILVIANAVLHISRKVREKKPGTTEKKR